jgi:serine/threonine-protein kinase
MHELKKCNSCGNTYSGTVSFCLNDGSPLVQLETMIGTVLDGRYRLDSLIGEGGMGDVYRATHIHIDTQLAVKLLKPEFVANQTAIKRFRLEAKAAGRIQHPNAVRTTDFGVTTEGIVYLVMELVEGPSLRSLMRSERKLDPLRTVNIVRQICGAVEAAHRSGVIHRDLKPDNILLEEGHKTERVKVLDFGIAKLRETKTDSFLTQAGTIIGTPQYMSPEQCQGKPLDARSDIYSIGILLYEMLSGDVPFDGESTLQVVYNQLHLHPPSLLERAPHIPPPLAKVIMRALEKEPERRQSSAQQLSEELKRVVESAGSDDASLLMDTLVTRPLRPADTPTPQAFGRNTAALARPSQETGATPTQDAPARSTSPEEKAPTAQSRLDAGPETQDVARGGAGRIRLLAIAAVALVALGAIALYVSMKPETQSATTTPVSQGPPPGMALIAGGRFLMGRNDGAPDEGPAHEVEVKSFFLDVQEVSNQDYKQFVDATGRAAPRHWTSQGSYPPDEAWLPVTHVTWEDAAAYAKWANKRLPTEAEWEYAARGGKGFLYPWGNQWLPNYANVDRKAQPKPAPVRSFEKDLSPFGIYDLAGNVSEWVQDNYSEKYGATPDPRFRVYRGGNFLDAPEKSTATFRWADYPVDIPADQILRVGFRCAKDAP